LTDVCIIGGGPAGATAARLLASWGWSVCVADRSPAPGSARPSLAESLPPSTRTLLAFLGLLEGVDAAGFHPNHGNLARWGGASRATHTDAAGFHVSRAAFDRVLRASARAAGARFVDASVRNIDVADPVRIDYVMTAGGRRQRCEARYVLDCSGRAGVVARRGLRQAESRYRTLAIAAEWESAGWPPDEHAHTLVESYEDGWAWSVPLSATRRQFTVMVEGGGGPKRGALQEGAGGTPQRGALQRIYAREIAKAREIGARLQGARQTSAAWGCDASLYHAPRAADATALLVGDAASFIEPLSSAGVKKALASAWRAAVVTNTCLSRPAMAGAAIEFYVQRELEVHARCRRLSAPFFSEAAAAHDHPFWSARAASVSGEVSGDDEIAREPDVRLAFDQLRRAARIRLCPAPALRVEPTAAIEGREVVMRDALLLPGETTPLRFAGGVNLPRLVDLTRECHDVPALIDAYNAQVGPVPVQGLLAGLSLLLARHALINEGAAP
jgi:flavin-dependent dehydrogenase